MKVAIPRLNDLIAPCFEAARQFQISVIDKGIIVTSEVIKSHSYEGLMNIRILHLHEVQTVICNGIKSFYYDQLTAMGINVIPNVNDSIQKALNRFINGEFVQDQNVNNNSCNEVVSHEELVSWAKKIFENAGYSISTFPSEDIFMIDLVASIDCPVCNKQIEVAICCGAQTYRADQEIREFYHMAKPRYNAQVYVYLKNSQLEKSCDDYGINFLSPDWGNEYLSLKNQNSSNHTRRKRKSVYLD